jgi:hypothetical protein
MTRGTFGLRRAAAALLALGLFAAMVLPANAVEKPYGSRNLFVFKFLRGGPTAPGDSGNTGGQFSKEQIERFRCTSSGNPAAAVDMSCNTTEFGQNFAPDNEIAVAVNPVNANHIVAGSNDYFYRFNNSTGARQAIVPTGFFTSFDGGATWIDGQIPTRSGNGAGDPSPAFDRRHSVVLMAQLENAGGQGSANVSQGDVSVSRSTDGGRTWSEPITVLKGQGTGIGPANRALFYDKEWLTVDNSPTSRFFGRAYVTSTRFTNGLHGSFARAPIVLSYSDDGGLTWSREQEVSGFHPSCTYQSSGPARECDENQFSIPEVAPDGTLYVHFFNGQNEAAWEVENDFDSQIMVIKSTDGGRTFGAPVQVVQLEDGLSDMPFSVIGRQTVWGHQIRWNAAGNISVNPANPLDISIVYADRGTPNPNATDECINADAEAPTYDPCNAGPGSDTNVYLARSMDGGATWAGRTPVLGQPVGHAWFPWADHRPDGTLAVAWDQDDGPAPADTFRHVLKIGAGAVTPLTAAPEQIDISVTHWAGQYVPRADWPVVCGPAGYEDEDDADAVPDPGKDCNVFHGDYTGLATGSDGSIHVVWTGLNVKVESPQLDFYTGGPHDGYRQDAMYARR